MLEAKLDGMACTMDAKVAAATGHGGAGYTMMDLYRDYWLPFGKLLTDMEDAGMMVNRRAPPAAPHDAWRHPCVHTLG